MVLEVLDVGGLVIPVDWDEVYGAVRAAGQEAAQVSKAHSGGGVAVCDGRSAELSLPCIRLHVLLVTVGGILISNIGLGAEVGFVKGQEVSGARGKGSADS